ncbi:GtrA family protein [Allosphingosinicella deserti]|uniref:GtrA/DPMS transmembrane domain-containing protein n=1 Tax=Allosphingosinicella deserti TaxID=2116704 RepID=A0A2P7QUM6_9SPHN|nr:GtrA family protein [Sphingomonas deserti]PSJ41671.1 hypothetical protein C7I55_05060 [Sphingomonas deserti]
MSMPAKSLRYLTVSAVCWVIHNATMIAGDAAGLPLLASIAASFAIVVVVGYLLHSRYTFETSNGPGSFVRYVLAMLPNFPLSAALLWLLSKAIGLPMVVAAPLATMVMLAVNYFGSRWAITMPDSRRHEQGTLG